MIGFSKHMAYRTHSNFLSNPNWITYFYDAAYPSPSVFPGPNMGIVSPVFSKRHESLYKIAPSSTYSIVYDGVETKDRREAVSTLFNEYPSLTTQPPTDWKSNSCVKGRIDSNRYTDGMIRRLGIRRDSDIYYDSAPANTYYGIGWYGSKGYIPPSPEPTQAGCLPSLLYRDV